MLPTLHNRAYQDFITLLTDFHNLIKKSQTKNDLPVIKQEFQTFNYWFEQNIISLNHDGIKNAYISRWQSVQREIIREFKLLTTDILFLASARQDATKSKRFQSIENRLNKLANYCRGLLEEANRTI